MLNVSSRQEALCRVWKDDALHLFENMNTRDPYVWNVVIRGLTTIGYFQHALEVYYRVQCEGIRADNFTYPFVIKACAGSFSLVEARKVHAKLIKVGVDSDIYIGNALVAMYTELGLIELERVFEELPVRDLVSWYSMIRGYVSVGESRNAVFFLFTENAGSWIEA